MGIGETKRDAIGREKGPYIVVKEFASIITLNTFDNNIKLSLDIGNKTLQGGRNVRFISKRKGP
jgi:hypothetical protein